uniref:TANGO6 HEAT repeat domain-containing protein n=1 Tax=Eptatretus burgeri TaxID=7764 RepID=A0A8C4N8B3_EPTBU
AKPTRACDRSKNTHIQHKAFTKTPAWLRNACGHLLSKRLAQSDGVQAVILGVLEGTTGGGIEDDAVFDWQKCDGVARVISRCPRHCSADHYYQSICPQVLSLLHSSDGPAARCMHHVAVRVVVTLAREHPGLAKHLLLDPLVEPLVRCLENNGLILFLIVFVLFKIN